MWEWFFETVEMVAHPKLWENDETRERADAVGGSEEDLSSFRQSVKYKEFGLVVDGFPSGKVDEEIKAWQNSKKTGKDFMELFKNLMNYVPEVHKQQVKESEEESRDEESEDEEIETWNSLVMF